MPFGMIKLKLNPRYELRVALLAAMETCWVFPGTVLLNSLSLTPLSLTPLPLFLAYWLAMIMGRAAPADERRLPRVLVLLGVAIFTMLVVVRLEAYPTFAWLDFSWLARYLASVSSLRGSLADVWLSIAALYMFLRGLGFAQRPLTLWFIGFQFRLGIVVFFFLLTGAAWVRVMGQGLPIDLSPWLFVYFFIALLAIALARIEEMASDVRYGPRWAITVLASIGLVLFLGVGVLQILTPATAQWFWLPIIFVVQILGGILVLLAIPAGILAGWLADWLRPLMQDVVKNLPQVNAEMPPEWQALLQQAQTAVSLPFVQNLGKLLVATMVLAIVGWLIARSLNRRMQRAEAEAYVREALGVADADAMLRAERKGFAKRKLRVSTHDLAANTIRKIYAALVARAADLGVPRQIAETPYEYEPRLEQHWHAESADIHTITEAYVNVHYAEHKATEAEASQVREAWERIKSVKRKT